MSSYYYTLTIPKALADEKRELFSSWLVRLGQKWNFQGIEDWQIDLNKKEFVLGVENEFHDLKGLGKKTDEILVYFGKKSDALGFRKILKTIFDDLTISSLRKLKKTDWMKEWRKHYKITKIQNKQDQVYIVPAWKRKPKTKNPVVKIYPGQAFGTGTHTTTKLCIQKILGFSKSLLSVEKLSILDFGAGTGILALVANEFKKNRHYILAVESDDCALNQAKKNFRINKAKIHAQRRVPKNKKFHFILANVLSTVLVNFEPYFSRALYPEGVLILSGILKKETESFLEEFNKEQNWKLIDQEFEKDWCVLTLKLL